MKAIFNRFREPSSWAALGVLGAVFGLPADATGAVTQAAAAVAGAIGGTTPDVLHAVTAVCAAVAFFLPEKRAVQ